jgi:hypothetical protein
VLLAASVAAVHVLDGKLKDADGSFEESTLAEHAAPMHYNDAEPLPATLILFLARPPFRQRTWC